MRLQNMTTTLPTSNWNYWYLGEAKGPVSDIEAVEDAKMFDGNLQLLPDKASDNEPVEDTAEIRSANDTTRFSKVYFLDVVVHQTAI